MESKAVRARVSGVVQGVYFRQSTRDEATRLGVRGWVRNLADGRVELHAEGPAVAVDALLAWAHRGPSSARVDAVDVEDVASEGHAGFEVRR